MMDRTLFIDPGRCIGCQACVAACRECDSHRGRSMISLDYIDAGRDRRVDAHRVHALRGPGGALRRGLSDRRDPRHGRRRRARGREGALHRMRELRARVPVRRAQARYGGDAPVQVQHVLRPLLGRAGTDVRRRLSDRRDLLREHRRAARRPSERRRHRPGRLRRAGGPHGRRHGRAAELRAATPSRGCGRWLPSSTDAARRRCIRADPIRRPRHPSRLPADPRHDLGRTRARCPRRRGRRVPPADRHRPEQ